MNGVVNTVTPIDVSTAIKQQQGTQSPDDGSFKSMLSDAANKSARMEKTGNRQSAEAKPIEKSTTTGEKPGKIEPQKQTDTRKESPEEDIEIQEDINQATPEAMQSMLMTVLPLPDVPQTEIPIETDAETAGFQPIQAMTAEPQAQTRAASEAGYQDTEISQQVPKADHTEEKPQEALESEGQTKSTRTFPESARAQAVEPETRARESGTRSREARESAVTDDAIQAEPRIQVRRQSRNHENHGASREAASDITDTQAARHPRQAVQMHNMRHSRGTDTTQSRFDEMISKASRELGKGITAEAPGEETGSPVKAFERTFTPEQNNPTAQTEAPRVEVKTEREIKPEIKEAAQKNAKAPITVQRPQKEISKPDDNTLGGTEQKPHTSASETVRSEPAPQRPAQTEAPNQAEQIKVQVMENLEKERTEFQMQLNPEELGKVNVKMILEGGKLTVEIAAVNPKSAEMLSKQAESLIASLKASDINVASVNVVTEGENASGQMNGAYDLNNFQNQFQNRPGGQEQNERGNSSGIPQGQTSENGNPEHESSIERAASPQRILNYAV